MNFKEKLRELLLKKDEEDIKITLEELSEITENWPKDSDGEPQSTENFEILEITDNSITIVCGGNWQEPMKIIIQYQNDKFIVVSHSFPVEYESGLSVEEIEEILK